MTILDRLQHAWNAFTTRDPPVFSNQISYGYLSTYRPDRNQLTRGNDRSIIAPVFNRIAVDCAAIDIRHIQLDDNNRYKEDIDSSLNNCLAVETNKDQIPSAFIQDLVMSMFDEGCIAAVPIDVDINPANSASFEIETMRVGKIVQWYPDYIKVNVYNDRTGLREDIIVPKRSTAIIENPFYAIMNERNSVLQRLVRKLNLLDAIDEQSGSGKLDLIIQLPYVIKTEARKAQAEERRADIEHQLASSKYGIAYTDGTEHITQLNRPVENNLMSQVEYLTSMLYSQLGITESVLDGTADEKTMLNYMKRTVQPIMNAITKEMKRKFLSRASRSNKETIAFFSNPFDLVPITNLAELADKLTRNEIVTPNEMRQIAGMKPSNDPKADELKNRNINSKEDNGLETTQEIAPITEEGGENQNG